MNELLTILKNLPPFLKYSLYLSSLGGFVWTFMFVVTSKLEGMIFTVSMISFFMFLSKLSNMFIIFFKNIYAKKVFLYLIILDVIYVFISGIFYYDKFYFMVIQSFLEIAYMFLLTIYHFNFQKMIAQEFSPKILQDYMYVAEYGRNISIGIALFMTFYINDVNVIFTIFVILLSTLLMYFRVKFYRLWIDS